MIGALSTGSAARPLLVGLVSGYQVLNDFELTKFTRSIPEIAGECERVNTEFEDIHRVCVCLNRFDYLIIRPIMCA